MVQVALLLEQCPNLRFVTVLLDGDPPGREAADAIATRLARYRWTRIAQLPDGAQPDTIDRAELEQLLGRGQR
jgi:DNA primase